MNGAFPGDIDTIEDESGNHRLLVVGVGGGGVNTVSCLAASWEKRPFMVAADTDLQALGVSRADRRIVLGRDVTRGLSTGSDANIGKLAANESADVLREMLTGFDVLCLVAALGGGTGGGAAPVIANLAREEDLFTLAFATLPFEFEGSHRMNQALTSLEELRAACDLVVALPNQALPEWVGEDAPLVEAFRSADLMAGLAIRSIWHMLAGVGIINLSVGDLRYLAEIGAGKCHFGYGEGAGPEKITQTIKALQESPTLNRGALLRGSPAVLVSLVGGSDLTLAEIKKVMNAVQQMVGSSGALRMGATIDEAWKDRMAVVLLACEPVTTAVPAGETRKGEAAQPMGRVIQPTFNLEISDKGRFKNTEPTIVEGEDLDIPTFIRRGIQLSGNRG